MQLRLLRLKSVLLMKSSPSLSRGGGAGPGLDPGPVTEGYSRRLPHHHDACGVAVPLPEQARGGSVFLCDAHLQPVEIGRERDLAAEARVLVAVAARIEQVVLVLADRRQLAEELGVDVDVAGG